MQVFSNASFIPSRDPPGHYINSKEQWNINLMTLTTTTVMTTTTRDIQA